MLCVGVLVASFFSNNFILTNLFKTENYRRRILYDEFLTSNCNSIISYDGSIKHTSSTYQFTNKEITPFDEFIEESIAPIELTFHEG